jgi:hypothetical protein
MPTVRSPRQGTYTAKSCSGEALGVKTPSALSRILRRSGENLLDLHDVKCVSHVGDTLRTYYTTVSFEWSPEPVSGEDRTSST